MRLRLGALSLPVAGAAAGTAEVGDEGTAMVRPERVSIEPVPADAAGDPDLLTGQVDSLTFHGAHSLVVVGA